MRLTVASEYGCLALLAIAEGDPELCKRHQIAERFGIPLGYLEQILRKLATAGFLVSRRGAEGGFRLARPAREIVIADVVRVMEGALAPVRSVSENFYQPSPLEASVAFHELFRRVRDAVAEILENSTLEDIVERERSHRHSSTRRGAGPGAPATRRTRARA